tara:strand:+ start:4500 stop:4706 length:207 start_codon:yes stop_codon:yes gene_type:complete
MDEFNEIIWEEYKYDVSLAEQLVLKAQAKLDTYQAEEDELDMPVIYFPGLGSIEIRFIPEEHYGEETY